MDKHKSMDNMYQIYTLNIQDTGTYIRNKQHCFIVGFFIPG